MKSNITKQLIIVFFAIILASCNSNNNDKKAETPIPTKKTIDISVLGLLKFGNVVVGDFRQSMVKIKNNTEADAVIPNLSEPFSVINKQAPCETGTVPAGEECLVSVRFKPLSFGDYTTSLEIGEAAVVFAGRGLIGGDIQLSETNISMGAIPAGIDVYKTLTLTNTGDFTVVFPTFEQTSDVKLVSNFCGPYIDSRKSCDIKFQIIKKGLGEQLDVVKMTASSKGSGTNTTPISFSSNVTPGSPSGNIDFVGTPPAFVANGEQVETITTNIIKDEYGNAVLDGTVVEVQLQNLTLSEPSNKFQTLGGKISFRVKSTIKKGAAAISVYSSNAYGVMPLYIRADKPFGLLSVLPFNPNMTADGNTQLILRFATIYDKNNNIVEDGTEIPIEIDAGGNLSLNNIVFSPAIKASTFNGSAQFVVKSSSSSGLGRITVRTNQIFNEAGDLIDHAAKGDFQVNFIPGDPFGDIPIVSQKGGINAVEEMTLVTIGPVRDRTGNVVATKTPFDLKIQNGVNISGTGSKLVTDSSGKASFILQGSGSRGPITISAASVRALGKKIVWAYKDSHLTLQGQKRDDWNLNEGDNGINSGRSFIKYYKASSDPTKFPPINDVWDEVFDYNKLAVADKNYYSVEKINGNPRTTLGQEPGFTFPLRIPTPDLLPKILEFPGPNPQGVPLFKSPVFFSAGEKLLNAPYWSESIPTPGTNLYGCAENTANSFMQYLYNSMMFTPKVGKYSCDYDGIVVTTNSPLDRKPEDTRANLYWPSVGYAEEPLGCSFDSGQSPVFTFKMGELNKGFSAERRIIVTNPNPISIDNLTISFSGAIDPRWSLSLGDCESSLPAQASCSFDVRFTSESSTSAGDYSASLKIGSTAVTSDVLLNVTVLSIGSAEPVSSDPVGMVVMKTNCYSKIVTFGGYNYIWNENRNNTVATSSRITSMFNVRGQLVSRFDNLCHQYATKDDCKNKGNGCSWTKDPDAPEDTPMSCENSVNLGSYPSRGKGFSPFVAVGKKLYQFSGFDPSGDGDVASDGLSELDTETGKWRRIDPDPDTTVDPLNPRKGEPAPRYQHAMVYVPETKSIYIYGGMSTSLEAGSIGDPLPLNDMWQLNLFPTPVYNSTYDEMETPPLRWKRICQECVPVPVSSIFRQILRNQSAEGPGYNNDPGVSYMVWNKPHKKLFIYFLGKSFAYWFDPTASEFRMNSLDSASGANFLASSYQVVYNPRLGRMFSYNHGVPNGNPYIPPSFKVWDMDVNEKTYFRTRFKLGDGSKQWATVVTPRIRAYGSAGPDAGCGDPCPGVSAYLYNHDTGTWSLIGENSAINDTQLKAQGEIAFSWVDAEAKQHISPTGDVDILIVPKGSPTEYNQVHIDSIYLDGTF